jgi:stage II sporulation protein R
MVPFGESILKKIRLSFLLSVHTVGRDKEEEWAMRKWTYFILVIIVLSGGIFFYQWAREDATQTQTASSLNRIPDQAIRLRILANSDRPEDQWLKRKVRDEVIREMNTWVTQPHTIEEARKLVKEHLPRFEEIARKTVREQGYDYAVRVDYGMVPFPTKLYGDQVYPAGDYEALRIQIGSGEGENWWCVLFPPLCFVDMSNGDAVKAKSPESFSTSMTSAQPVYASEAKAQKEEQDKKPEVRFFLLDQAKKWMDD